MGYPRWYAEAKRAAESRGHKILSRGCGQVRCERCGILGDFTEDAPRLIRLTEDACKGQDPRR